MTDYQGVVIHCDEEKLNFLEVGTVDGCLIIEADIIGVQYAFPIYLIEHEKVVQLRDTLNKFLETGDVK